MSDQTYSSKCVECGELATWAIIATHFAEGVVKVAQWGYDFVNKDGMLLEQIPWRTFHHFVCDEHYDVLKAECK